MLPAPYEPPVRQKNTHDACCQLPRPLSTARCRGKSQSGPPSLHDTQQHENVSDHDRGEQFEKILHPKVHHPEPPEIGCGEMRSGMRQQPYRIKGGDGKGREEEQPRHVAHVLRAETPTQSTEKNDVQKKRPNDQENLPESSQVEILKALISKPLPPLVNPPCNPGVFAQPCCQTQPSRALTSKPYASHFAFGARGQRSSESGRFLRPEKK